VPAKRKPTGRSKKTGRRRLNALAAEESLKKGAPQSHEDVLRDQWQRNEAELRKLSAVPQDKLKPYFQRVGELLCEQEFIENELSMDGPAVSERWSGKF
jgi:hypothetical protein